MSNVSTPADASVQGRVAIVTGAGNGIGRAIAMELGRRGARVVVNDLGTSLNGQGQDASAAEAVALDIRQTGGSAVANADSVSDAAGAGRIVQAALDHFGRVDAVVNNAGILRDRMFHKMSEEEWDAVLSVHLKGSFNVSRAAVAHMREQRHGRLVHMTSGAGLIGNIGQANYSAAKMGIVGLSRSIALELKDHGVRSNCIAPVAWSRMVAAIPSNTPEQQALAEKRQRLMAPHKIAPLAVYLASDACTASGQIFGVRGNEIILYSQPRPLRSAQMAEGWTVEGIAGTLMPNFESSLCRLETTVELFQGEPM
ncbi:Putative short-chain type dehydrogenase/reductase [Variovorax sp. SRS16]|uniref:SDR family NAD(P)-dependent oxidoreductase n=1 Tax=Variovorax sp. SRS16 TaxID=282217 RepID=UPI0013160955|nr:SDR family NAD(P)-dependent oxidoreductase [Variovorax sp. SRS16]VTU24396.1 Putative short-chain type dehydrogenase/reductase [Variovorax sp. SRS16]